MTLLLGGRSNEDPTLEWLDGNEGLDGRARRLGRLVPDELELYKKCALPPWAAGWGLVSSVFNKNTSQLFSHLTLAPSVVDDLDTPHTYSRSHRHTTHTKDITKCTPAPSTAASAVA